MPNDAEIKIYTITGEWVRTLNATGGSVGWDLANDGGQDVASGYYIYLIEAKAGEKKHGKIAIVR
jgi:hypothetical protein